MKQTNQTSRVNGEQNGLEPGAIAAHQAASTSSTTSTATSSNTAPADTPAEAKHESPFRAPDKTHPLPTDDEHHGNGGRFAMVDGARYAVQDRKDAKGNATSHFITVNGQTIETDANGARLK